MHPLPLLLGLGAVALVVVFGWLRRAMAVRPRCPSCGTTTTAVKPPSAARTLAPWLRIRWCAGCGWKGMARQGPAFDPVRGPADDDSGFRWSASDDTPFPGFAWRSEEGEEEDDASAPPAAHGSGFRWADTDEMVTGATTAPRRPGGFLWAHEVEDDEEARTKEGFVWGDGGAPRRKAPPTFVWGPTTRRDAPRPGFRFADRARD